MLIPQKKKTYMLNTSAKYGRLVQIVQIQFLFCHFKNQHI